MFFFCNLSYARIEIDAHVIIDHQRKIYGYSCPLNAKVCDFTTAYGIACMIMTMLNIYINNYTNDDGSVSNTIDGEFQTKRQHQESQTTDWPKETYAI